MRNIERSPLSMIILWCVLLSFGMWGPAAVSSATVLFQAAASLSPGEDTTGLGETWTGGGLPTGDDVNWINKFHYDPVRQVAFIVTKIQNNNTAMEHGWYDENANQWISENCGFNAAGHAYDIAAYDHQEGTGYLVPGGGRDDVLWTSTWTTGQSLSQPTIATSSAVSQLGSILYSGSNTFISGAGAMDWHPNLFGTGDAGMVVVCQKGVGGWRKSTDTWHIIVPSGNFTVPPGTPCCVYSRGLDAAIVSVNKDGNKLFKIDDYQTWISSDDAALANAPIPFGPDRGGTTLAALVDDPLERSTMYALEKGGGGRVWKYDNGSWALQSFKHPFTAQDNNDENWMIAALYGHGCLWALERSGSSTPRSHVWRPDDIVNTISRAPAAVVNTRDLAISPNPWNGGKLSLMSASGQGWIQISDLQGREVARFPAKDRTYWDGKDGKNRVIAPGIYLIRLLVKGKITSSVKMIAAF